MKYKQPPNLCAGLRRWGNWNMHVRGISRALLLRCTSITVNESSTTGVQTQVTCPGNMRCALISPCRHASIRNDICDRRIVRFSCMSSPNWGFCATAEGCHASERSLHSVCFSPASDDETLTMLRSLHRTMELQMDLRNIFARFTPVDLLRRGCIVSRRCEWQIVPQRPMLEYE